MQLIYLFSEASLVAQMVSVCLKFRRPGFNPWIGKIPWRRENLPIPVFWSGEFHGQSMESQRIGYHFHFLNFSNAVSH